MANKRAQLNAQLFNQAVAMGHSPANFGGAGGGGAYTNYLRGLIAQGPKTTTPAPTPPPTPKPVADTTPRKMTDSGDGDNLRIRKKSKKKRREFSRGTGQLRINPTSAPNVGMSAGAASSGGVNI